MSDKVGDARAKQVNRSIRLLETVAEHATDEFAWPAPLTLEMQSFSKWRCWANRFCSGGQRLRLFDLCQRGLLRHDADRALT
jgi:hypothetical protein